MHVSLSASVHKADADDNWVDDMIASPDSLPKCHHIIVGEKGGRLGLQHRGNGVAGFEDMRAVVRVHIDEVSLR
jgi:hypothetical protein